MERMVQVSLAFCSFVKDWMMEVCSRRRQHMKMNGGQKHLMLYTEVNELLVKVLPESKVTNMSVCLISIYHQRCFPIVR